MKKVLLVVVGMLGMASCYGQFGVKGGLNLANFGSDAENNQMRPALHLGVSYELSLAQKFSVYPELQYSLQGANAEDSEFAFDQSVAYINLMMPLSYNIGEKLSINAGPYLGMLVGAQAKSDGGDIDNKDLFKSTDFGLTLGGTFKINSAFGIGLHYLMGLADITDDGEGTETVVIDGFPVEVEQESQNITNRVIQLSLSYRLN